MKNYKVTINYKDGSSEEFTELSNSESYLKKKYDLKYKHNAYPPCKSVKITRLIRPSGIQLE